MATAVKSNRSQQYELSNEEHAAMVKAIFAGPTAQRDPSAAFVADRVAIGRPDSSYADSVTAVLAATNDGRIRRFDGLPGPTSSAHGGLDQADVVDFVIEHGYLRPSTIAMHQRSERIRLDREAREREAAERLSARVVDMLADIRAQRRETLLADLRRNLALLVTTGDSGRLELVDRLAAEVGLSDSSIRGAIEFVEQVVDMTQRVDDGEGDQYSLVLWRERHPYYFSHVDDDGTPRLWGYQADA